MNRRQFIGMMVGGVAASAAVRTWPFRVFSFPSEPGRAYPVDAYGGYLTGEFEYLADSIIFVDEAKFLNLEDFEVLARPLTGHVTSIWHVERVHGTQKIRISNA